MKTAQQEKRKLFTTNYSLFTKKGFTLVEILVAITILATLTVGVITTLNPKGQLDKAQDAVRQKDLQQVKLALDLYYNDKNCYPSSTTSPFTTALNGGTQWKEGTTTYIQKVPLDPTKIPYTYIADNRSCPQWATIFSKLSRTSALANACSLTAQSNCTPPGFDSSWACTTLGSIGADCSVLLAGGFGSLPVQAPTPTGTPTGTSTSNGTGTLTPTPTPPSSDVGFTAAQPAGTNPQFYQGTVSPEFQQIGRTQKISVQVAGNTANVASVSVVIKSDTKIQTYNATMTAGTVADGTWTAQWTVNDTTIKRYMITLNGTDSAGISSTFDISIR